MPVLLENPSPLRRIRDEAGLTAQEVAEKVRLILGEKRRHYSSIIQMERRGTDKHTVIQALAEIYELPPDEVAAAAGVNIMTKSD